MVGKDNIMPPKSITDYMLVKDLLNSVGGTDAIPLVKFCETKKKQVTDEEISKKMKKKVTEIRTVLNRLHYRGIACYQKKKNVKTGWYNYTWEIKKDRIAEILLEQHSESLNKLVERRDFESNYSFFDCVECNQRTPFEVAAEYNFVCPSCGKGMKASDNETRMKDISKKIGLIEKELKEITKLK